MLLLSCFLLVSWAAGVGGEVSADAREREGKGRGEEDSSDRGSSGGSELGVASHSSDRGSSGGSELGRSGKRRREELENEAQMWVGGGQSQSRSMESRGTNRHP